MAHLDSKYNFKFEKHANYFERLAQESNVFGGKTRSSYGRSNVVNQFYTIPMWPSTLLLLKRFISVTPNELYMSNLGKVQQVLMNVLEERSITIILKPDRAFTCKNSRSSSTLNNTFILLSPS